MDASQARGSVVRAITELTQIEQRLPCPDQQTGHAGIFPVEMPKVGALMILMYHMYDGIWTGMYECIWSRNS